MLATATIFRQLTYFSRALSSCCERKRAKAVLALLLAALASGTIIAVAQTSALLEVESRANSEYANLFLLYRHLHANPELSFHESKTSERLQQELRSVGFEVTGNFGGHGLVGVFTLTSLISVEKRM